jgi:hypothetical protein
MTIWTTPQSEMNIGPAPSHSSCTTDPLKSMEVKSRIKWMFPAVHIQFAMPSTVEQSRLSMFGAKVTAQENTWLMVSVTTYSHSQIGPGLATHHSPRRTPASVSIRWRRWRPRRPGSEGPRRR